MTVYSKAVLRAVAGQLVMSAPDVDFFPSFEIISPPWSKISVYARTGKRKARENRSALQERGIAYPGAARNHQSIAWSLKRKADDATEIKRLLTVDPEAKTVVLSAEDFCIHTNLQWLKEISQTWQTQVVFYLRRQDHWLMSWYNQHVKWPFDRQKSQMDKTEFLKHIGEFHWLDYESLLNRWDSVLGKEKVSAAVVETGQVEDVIGDFIVRLGISTEGLNMESIRKNDSLPVHTLEISRNLGVFKLPPRSRALLNRALREGLSHKSQSAKTIYSPAERIGVLERYQKSNQATARRMFGRDQLFFESSPAPDEPFFSFPEISNQELLAEWIAPLLEELLPSCKVPGK